MRNVEEWCEETLFTQLFECCTSPKKTTSVWRECLSHVQPRDQKSSLHWAASPTSANASSPCLLLTCPECWTGWWPWRAWSKAHLWHSTSEAELPWPDGPLRKWASMLKDDSSSSRFLTTNQWTKLHTPSSWQNTKGLTWIALENMELIWRVWCCDFQAFYKVEELS